MALPGDLDALCPTELKALVVPLLGKVAALEQTVAAQRAEIVRLKGLKGRPQLKPSGMEEASEPKPPSPPKGRRGPVTPRVAVEDQVIEAAAPPGSRFKGYADFLVQDLVLRARCHPLSPGALADTGRPPGCGGRCRSGSRPLRAGACAALCCPSTITGSPRVALVAQLQAIGLAISPQVMRLLIDGQQGFWRGPRRAPSRAGAGRLITSTIRGPPQGRKRTSRRSSTTTSLGLAPRPARAG